MDWTFLPKVSSTVESISSPRRDCCPCFTALRATILYELYHHWPILLLNSREYLFCVVLPQVSVVSSHNQSIQSSSDCCCKDSFCIMANRRWDYKLCAELPLTAEEQFQAMQKLGTERGRKARAEAKRASRPRPEAVNVNPGTPEPAKASPSPSKRKLDDISSSSLSSTSPHASPMTGPLTDLPRSRQKSRASSTSSVESHQPPPAPSIAQYQTFGPDPTTFDDPTIYHIRSVTDDMTYEEKAEIFSVAHFPESDLSPLIAGTIPDKDFSNAKPANQVNANTFQAYIDPYLRPLTEEDMAFLKERVRWNHIGCSPRKTANSHREIE